MRSAHTSSIKKRRRINLAQSISGNPAAMMSAFASLAFFCGVLTFGLAVTPTENYPDYLELMPNDVYHLFWKFNTTDITFEVHVKTHGWVGFGLSPNGDMPGADVIIGWVKSTGEVVFHDRHAKRQSRPDIDVTQNWFLLYGAETATHTVLKFTRKLQTCDDDDMEITDGTARLIFSFNDNEPSNDKPAYHGENRSTKSVFLLGGVQEVPLPPDAISYDLRMSNISVPSADTTYWCEVFAAPALTSKHHIVRIDPLIDAGNENLVHHILMYGCSSNLDPSNVGYNEDCYTFDSNVFLQCFYYMFVWAVGAGPFYFPDNVGLPLGPGFTSAFLRLEVHYDNPLMTSGRFDNSGFRLWYTPTLRLTDAGLIEVGQELFPYQLFPPNFPSLDTYGYCTRECLEQGMGSTNEIKIFAGFPHAHLVGRRLTIMHIRNGTELKPIMEDNFYDFNFQEMRTLQPEVTVKKGDAITVRCNYDTTGRTTTTTVGFGTQDEMCFGFMFYYPAINLHRCDSLLEQYESLRYLNAGTEFVNGEWVVASGPYQGMNLNQAVEATNWNSQSKQASFQEATASGDIRNYCYGEEAFEHPAHDTIQPSTPVNTPYVPPPNGC